jgi:uncharacterized protein (DUF934 family)
MQHLIKLNKSVPNDPWQVFEASEEALPGNALLPVSIWKDTGHELQESSLEFGVFVQENETLEEITPFLSSIKVIAFKFAKFADGRAFTYARQLRDQLGFTGEIRAFGDFMPDQVAYLERCGFDAFAMRTEAEVTTALSIKGLISETYQTDSLESKPLYRRR